MRIGFLLRTIVLLLSAFPISADAKTLSQPGDREVLHPFDYRDVTLDGGRMRQQFDDVKAYYLRIPNDDLLKGFRRRAGKPAPGAELGSWYSDDIFHIFGQIVSGLSRFYAASGDPACRDKANALVHEWGLCIEADGYFYYSRKPNAPHYTYEKMVCGLVDNFLYCKNPEAAQLLERITEYAEKNLDRKREYGFNWGGGPTEWYTLSENLYRAYRATGNPRYRDFARVWEYSDYWNLYASGQSIFTKMPAVGFFHAYSHVNNLNGAAEAYRVTGEKHYLATITNAFDYLQANQCYATGGFGPDERLLPPEQLGERLRTGTKHFEIQCGSWAGFKLSKSLITFTGDARYGDWIERLLYNGIGASMPSKPNGAVHYYADYNESGGSKDYFIPWSCCAGSRSQAVADYVDLIYFKEPNSLYVNLFTPSTVRWSTGRANIAVRQETRFPEDGAVTFTVETSRTESFALKLRRPSWLSNDPTFVVNRKQVEVKKDKKGWLTIDRRWMSGDQVQVHFPLELHAVPFPPRATNNFPAAIACGPIVLAFRAPTNPAKKIDFQHLNQTLIPSPGEPLTYHLANDPSVLLRPLYDFQQGEKYFLCLDPTNAATRVSPSEMKFSDGWREDFSLHVTPHVGATVECAFEGTGVGWIGHRYDDGGRGVVEIDGRKVDSIEFYGPGRDLPLHWEHAGLVPGRHTLKMTVLPDKHSDSKNTYVNLSGIEVIE